jgi:hypothetical protein
VNAPANGRAAAGTHRVIGALAVAIMLLAAGRALRPPQPRLVPAAPGEGEAFARGPFAEHAYCASDSQLPPGVPARGSWLGSNDFTGTYVSGWFQARPRVTVWVSGYPGLAGNSLALEIRTAAGGVERRPFAGAEPRENWRPWRITLPAGATVFRLTATDGSTRFYGWLGVSAPLQTRFSLSLLPEAQSALLAFAAEGVLFLALGLALHGSLRRRVVLPAGLGAFAALAGVAVLGYLAFWCYFASPLLGRVFSWTVLAAAGLRLLAPRRAAAPGAGGGEVLPALGLAGLIGIGFLSLTCLFDDAPLSALAESRFTVNLPVDNDIPRMFADRLWAGQSPRHLVGDWLSSDRPPLQAGWQLLTRPVSAALGFDDDTAATTAGVWFQLLWVPALWTFLRRLGAGPRVAAAMVAAAAFTGFHLFYTVYTWPKLGAAALMLGAFVLWEPGPGETAGARRFAAGGICAALACLAHGGAAFSLLGLVPLGLAALRRERGAWRRWLVAGVAFAAVASPWLAYQKFYEPPGNRLPKWHLAGVIPPDARGFGETLVDSYRHLGWRGALANHWSNLQLQWTGTWRDLLRFRPAANPLARRVEEITFTGRTLGWWLPAALALLWVLWSRRRDSDRMLARASLWWVCGWLVWLALMFLPDSARCHQGTLVTQLLGFALLFWAAWSVHRLVFLLFAGLQIAGFLVTWVAPSPDMTSPANPLAAAVAIAAALGLAGLVVAGTAVPRRPRTPAAL